MLDLYRKLTAKFPGYHFGYNGDSGVEMQIAVISKKTQKAARAVLDYGLSPKEYAIEFFKLLEGFGEKLVHDTKDV